jgi:ubiquinone/menaquinone biosynthesis C-methylase UbiE
MPFEDRAFEASLAMYVLHHTPDPGAVLAEMKRVTARRILIVEEVYRHWPGKLRLALLDAWVNTTGGLKSKIRWRSYLDRPRLRSLGEAGGWTVTELQSTPHAGFDEVLWVMERS